MLPATAPAPGSSPVLGATARWRAVVLERPPDSQSIPRLVGFSPRHIACRVVIYTQVRSTARSPDYEIETLVDSRCRPFIDCPR